jgi:hypothetical protein
MSPGVSAVEKQIIKNPLLFLMLHFCNALLQG